MEDAEEMTSVWRWEGEADNLGPYRWTPERFMNPALMELRDLFDRVHEDGSHPGPWRDGLKTQVSEGWWFGCSSRESLDDWFKEVPEELLRAAGMVIRVYEVPSRFVAVSESGRQVAFSYTRATLASTL